MFTLKKVPIDGCWEIQPRILNDQRGRFVKTFHKETFERLGLETNFVEDYYSRSIKGVIRGMHFQTPPADHVKMVNCVEGEVLDVVLDLRLGSPTYGKATTIHLSSEIGNSIYIPKGLAHGFCVVSEAATLVYKVSSAYAPENDLGVLWSSVDVTWPNLPPLVSPRDASLPPFAAFKSPFVYDM